MACSEIEIEYGPAGFEFLTIHIQTKAMSDLETSAETISRTRLVASLDGSMCSCVTVDLF